MSLRFSTKISRKPKVTFSIINSVFLYSYPIGGPLKSSFETGRIGWIDIWSKCNNIKIGMIIVFSLLVWFFKWVWNSKLTSFINFSHPGKFSVAETMLCIYQSLFHFLLPGYPGRTHFLFNLKLRWHYGFWPMKFRTNVYQSKHDT